MKALAYFGIADGKNEPQHKAPRNKMTPLGMAVGIATPLAITAVVVLVPTTAQAATDGMTNTGGCPGFVVDSYPVPGAQAHVELSYDSSTESNCARLVNDKGSKAPREMSVQIHESGNTSNGNSEESVEFGKYVGPIVIGDMGGKCVDVSANVDGQYALAKTGVHCG